MVRRLDLAIGLDDAAVGTDQIADPGRVLALRVVGGAIGDTDLLVDVAQKVEGKIELVAKGPLVGGRIETDSQDDRVFGAEVLDSVTEPLAFSGSTGRVGLGVEPEHDIMPPVLLHAGRYAVMVRKREIRRRVPLLQHCHG